MIGIILLIIAVFLYITGRKRWSLLLFVSFVTRGLGFLTDDVIGIKNHDLAFVYTIVICIYSYFYEKKPLWDDKWLRILIISLFIFLLCSVLFSYYHYGFTSYQILQGGRHHFLFLSYFFLRKTKKEDVLWLFKTLFYITGLHAALYVIQVMTGATVLPYENEVREDPNTGVLRYYNFPHLLEYFLYATLLFPLRKHFQNNIAAIILLAALFCTQWRTGIIIAFICLLLGYLIRGRLSGTIRIGLLIGLIMLPFSDILLSRFGDSGTDEDIESVLSGDFVENVQFGYANEGTLSFRFAWVYERATYLSDRPMGENVFGLGLISDSQKELVNQKYHFTVGLKDQETDLPVQLATADIAYGNMLTAFGYVGGTLLLLIWIYLAILFYRHRKGNGLLLCMCIFIINRILGSVSGAYISTTGYLAIPFLLLPLLYDIRKTSSDKNK